MSREGGSWFSPPPPFAPSISPATDKLDRPHSLIPFSYSLNLSSLSGRGSGGRRGGAPTSNQSPHYSWQNGANNLLIPCLRGSARTERMALIGYGGRGEQHGASASQEDSAPPPSTAAPPLRALGERQTERERERQKMKEGKSREKRERPNHGKKNKKTTEWGKKKRCSWGKDKDGETKGGWGKCRKMQERQAFVRESTETEKGEKTCIILLYCLYHGTYIWVDFTMPDCFTLYTYRIRVMKKKNIYIK